MVATMLVGLTGGIACGKTTVAQMLAAKGASIVDADQVARDVVDRGTEGLTALVSAFGDDILTAEGELDRTRLGSLVFADQDARQTVNGILHPRIANESLRQIKGAFDEGATVVIYDAALLVETGRADDFRPLLVVAAPTAVQRARLMARDELSESEAQQRIDAQMPLQDKAAAGDFVIHNDGSYEETQVQVDAFWTWLFERTKR